MSIIVLAVIGIVVVAAIFIVGGMDNNRPVSEWPDDKLFRMKEKLAHAGSIAFKANQLQTAKEHYAKLEEVKAEIERRTAQRATDLVSKVSTIPVAEALNSTDVAQLMGMMGQKMAELTSRIMRENSCSEEQARKIISAKIEKIESELKSLGISEDKVAEESMKRILLL